MYRIPRQWHHSTGIQFESIDATESLRLIEPIVAELGYTGQISFDFLGHRRRAQLRRVQPARHRRRAAADAASSSPAACSTPTPTPSCCRPARRRSSTSRLVGDAFSDHIKRLPQTIRDLARVKDAGDGWHDPLPTLYSAFSVAHFAGVSHREHASSRTRWTPT